MDDDLLGGLDGAGALRSGGVLARQCGAGLSGCALAGAGPCGGGPRRPYCVTTATRGFQNKKYNIFDTDVRISLVNTNIY